MEGRQSQMKSKRSMHDASGDSDMNDSIDNMTHDDIFLPAAMQPTVTINESPRFDAPNVANVTSVKREGNDGVVISRPQSPTALYRSTYSKSSFNFFLAYSAFSFARTDNTSSMQNSSFQYYPDFSSNDLSINHNNSSGNGTIDMSKSHMDVPPGKKKTLFKTFLSMVKNEKLRCKLFRQNFNNCFTKFFNPFQVFD